MTPPVSVAVATYLTTNRGIVPPFDGVENVASGLRADLKKTVLAAPDAAANEAIRPIESDAEDPTIDAK